MQKNIFKKITILISLSFLLSGLFFPIHFSLALICTAPQVPSSDGTSCVTPPEPLGTCRLGTAGQPEQNTTQKNCEDRNSGKGSNDIKWIWISYYYTLAPLPCDTGTPGCVDGKLTTYDPTQNNNIGGYLNMMIRLFIGICAVLAVIMIVYGGIEYMTSELPGLKSEGKDRIIHAILGLLLALGAWTLLYTINPNLLDVSLSSLKNVTVEVTLADQLKSYSGQGPCTPVADSSNPCSATSLANAGFTNATQASSICNGESKGTANLASGVDKGSDGNSFSFGLFQVNVLAHANEIKDQNGNLVCSGVFTVDPNPSGKVGNSQNDNTLGGCLQRNGSICVKYAAVVTNQAKYQACKNYITSPTNNIAYAAKLQTSRNWGQWGANASCHF